MIINLAELRGRLAVPAHPPAEFDHADPRALIPLSLEQQKKQAKDLLRGWRNQDAAALARAPGTGAWTAPRLSDAQQLIATEQGFRKWTDLKAHIERMDVSRRALARGEPSALDAGAGSLHIRCGSDVMHKLAIAGFGGDYLSFADPYVQGPVPETDSLEAFIAVRADFLAAAGFVSRDEALKRLTQDYAALGRAHHYPRVLLWLEHDSYDQLILARLLHHFSQEAQRPARLRLLCVTRFPGVRRFNGLGQLPPEALRVLWTQFADVAEPQLSLGHRAWKAVTAPTPVTLQDLLAQGTPALPTLAPALKRHLQELPSVENGLSLTEHLTLQILADKGGMNAARLFGWYSNHYEPLTFLGDTGYWSVLSGLARARHPAVHLERTSRQPKEWRVALTPLGRQVLARQADWLTLNNVQRWVGGVRIDGETGNNWRFDGGRGVVLRHRTP